MLLLAAVTLLSHVVSQPDPIKIVVHAGEHGQAISKDLYGVFFEEINHAGDGGLNPELLRNFNMREPGTAKDPCPGWIPVGGSGVGTVLSGKGEVALSRTQAGDSIFGCENSGYWGIALQKGEKYRFSILCRSTLDTPVQIRLTDASGKTYAERSIISSDQISEIKGVLTPSETVSDARLQITMPKTGTVEIKTVSLKPVTTWKDHGLRPDLASMVDGMHPAFVRFPGGCYVEGGDFLADRFRWETTLNAPGFRPGHKNTTWKYWSTDGLGYHEYLQWCEDMGAEALFVVNCGFSHKETVAGKDLESYVASTLDALEYALGPVTSPFGAARAQRGHPEPFPLKYIEVGNENGQGGWTSGGSPTDYAKHYEIFAAAIKARYPQVTLVADTRVADGAEMVDDHYYNSPSWFWRNTRLYDKSSRTGPKVYVGEYAVTTDCGNGNLRAALAEAAFLTGLERNSDLVQMASYAPLFVNVNNRAWNPDAICFDGSHSYGTPSYYTQALFAANRGDTYLPTDFPDLTSSETWNGGIGLGTWKTAAEYKDISVTAEGKTVYSSDFSKGTTGWKSASGDWSVADGSYRQSVQSEDNLSFLEAPMSGVSDCTVRLKARKIGGGEGFLILFHAKDSQQYLWWNIGGWANTETGVEAITRNGKYPIGRNVRFGVETGKWYDIRIEVKGAQMQLFMDDKLVQTVRASGSPTFAVASSRVEKNGDLILKVVNGSETDRNTSVELDGVPDGAFDAAVTTMTSSSTSDENSLEAPTKVSPKSSTVNFAHSSFSYNFPARSITVLRLHRK